MEATARGRIFQSTTFEVVDLTNLRIEQLIGWTDESHRDDWPLVIALKASGSHWYRFFWDAGSCFCEESTELDSSRDFEDVRQIDYADAFAIRGQIIESVTCAARQQRSDELWIALGSGAKLILRHLNPVDSESPTVFQFEDRTDRCGNAP